MELETWILFVITETVLCLSPGPAVLLVFSMAMTKGWRAGAVATSGILLANLIYFVLSGTGLVAILIASPNVFYIMKSFGAVYLIWTGLQMLFGRSDDAMSVARQVD